MRSAFLVIKYTLAEYVDVPPDSVFLTDLVRVGNDWKASGGFCALGVKVVFHATGSMAPSTVHTYSTINVPFIHALPF